ncbi:MAG: hypothetical protein MMC23_006610 [Stictis urceolatum]|nr:hypothetical protein [Stictis urceolata]
MASTRHPQPLKIFQDPDPTLDFGTAPENVQFDPNGPLTSPLDSLPPLLPNSNGFGNTGIGPVSASGGNSPTKQSQPSSSPPSRVPFSDKLNVSLPPPVTQSFPTDSPLKKHNVGVFQSIASNIPPRSLFPSFPNTNKENMRPRSSDNLAEFPSDPTGDTYKSSERRTYDSLDGCSETVSKKKQKNKVEPPPPPGPVFIPDPKDMPVPVDDGNKPNASYAQLIGMAILRAPNRRLTLAQIYKWISDTFAHYRLSGAGWQNSIRHNLSLSEHFIKQNRPKDDPGKGSYWTIKPGHEHNYLNQKSRRPTSSSANMRVLQQVPSSETNAAPTIAPPSPKEEKKAPPTPEEPSSDATIIDSDPALLEDAEEPSMPPPPSRGPLSSPIDHIRSSPPVPRHAVSREATPSNDEAPSSTHNSRSRKQKHTMQDSGYFSSLESSAMRPYLFSAADRDAVAPRFKRGRAEEEIARIRSSSHDLSPTRARASLKPQSATSLLSSSPTRAPADSNTNALMLPPLTPAVTFKKPHPKPAPAISPNTNLRNHRNKIREMIGSPLKNFNALDDENLSFSPAFDIVDEEASDLLFGPTGGFDIFVDSPIARKSFGSPLKRDLNASGSAKRLRFDRPGSAASILADVTGTNLHTANAGLGSNTPHTGLTPNPALKPPSLGSPLRHLNSRSPSRFVSPTKGLNLGGFGSQGPSPFKAAAVDMEKGDFWGLDLFVDENGGLGEGEDEFGLDLCGGGWRAIGEKDVLGWDIGKENVGVGAGRKGKGGSAKKSRPVLGGRSATSRF